MRSVLQGVEPATSWNIHLQLEGIRVNDQMIHELMSRICCECAAAARRDGKYHVSRLLRLNLLGPDGEDSAFGADREAATASPEELTHHLPTNPRSRAHKRARLLHRQLEALRDFEAKMLAIMSTKDSVRKWLPAKTAKLLEEAGVGTLSLLAARINCGDVRWWRGVRSVAHVKATRIADWAYMHATDIGIRIVPTHGLAAGLSDCRIIEQPSTALVPLERLLVPWKLDGHDGAFRLPSSECTLEADNDLQAIQAWLDNTQNASGSTGTFRSYRREAERLLLWCVLVRHKPVSSLTRADVRAFRDFLMDPPAHWCGYRGSRRDSVQWRPMEKGLSAPTLGQALTIIGALFKYLVTHQYVYHHPLMAPRVLVAIRPDARLQRTLTFEQWEWISRDLIAELKAKAAHEPTRRRARAIRWLYATGLSLSELVSVQCGALRLIRFARDDGEPESAWMVRVVDKYQRTRDVPLPRQLIVELGDELAAAGRPRAPTARVNARVPVVGRFSAADGGVPPPWTAGALYKSIKIFMEACASHMNSRDAMQVRQASASWLRNTHSLHAVLGRSDGERKPVPPQYVAMNVGSHSPWLVATHQPLTEAQRQKAMKDFWPPDGTL
jgi:site-specific recombinase XerD